MKQHNLAGLTSITVGPILYLLLFSFLVATKGETAERFFISIPGPTLSYAPPVLRSRERLLLAGRSGAARIGSPGHNRCQQSYVR